MTTTTSTKPEPITIRPQAVKPSWAWVAKRTVLGLTIMLAVTGIAAFIAHASIDTSADVPDQGITIGTPAAALLKKGK